MDASLITDLPASAQRVLAEHLGRSDAGTCRQASRQLCNVALDRAGSRLWVVASSFKSQIERDAWDLAAKDDRFDIAMSWRDAGGPTISELAAVCDPLMEDPVNSSSLSATSLAAAAQGVLRAEVLVDASRPCAADVWQALFRSLLSSPTLRELTITEYATHNSKGLSDALTNREIQSTSTISWTKHKQGSSSSSSSAQARPFWQTRRNRFIIAAADCTWLPALVAALEQRHPQGTAAAASQQQQQEQQQQQDEERVQAAPLNLTLQLLAPLLPQHSMQLVHTQGLAGLSVVKTPAWLDPSTKHQQGLSRQDDSQGVFQDFPFGRLSSRLWLPVPVLPTTVLRQLKGLRGLSSLGCTIGRPAYKEKPGEVGTMLQDLLLDLGPQLTQLTLGTPQSAAATVHYGVSAPLRMPALRSLTCNLGVSLDVETDDEAMLQIQQQQQQQPSVPVPAAAEAPRGTSSGTSSSMLGDSGVISSSDEVGLPAEAAAAAAAIPKQMPALLPSLTELILIDPACVPDVIERAASSEAACRQLRRLEIPQLSYDDDDDVPDYNSYNDQRQRREDPAVGTLQQLGQLQGLQELKVVVCGQRQLDTLVAAVGFQLEALTVTCQERSLADLPVSATGTAGAASQVQLQPLFNGMPHLTRLKIIGSTGATLDPSSDLPAAAQHLTALRQLNYTGRIFALPSRGFELLPGTLPSCLQGLTLIARQSGSSDFDADGSYTLHLGSLPQGLTSLKCRGFWWQRPEEVEPWSPWFGWECLPAALRQLELAAEAPLVDTGLGSFLPVSSPTAASDAADAAAAAAAAVGELWLQGSPETIPRLVCLPALESLGLYIRANRHAADTEEPERLPFAALLKHLAGLTNLTQLHISSKLGYTSGDSCKAVSSLVQLKVLTIDVDFLRPQVQRPGDVDPRHDDNVFEALLDDLYLHLASTAGLRVLRLPLLSAAEPDLTQLKDLRRRLGNCLIVESDDMFLDAGLLGR